MDFLGIHPRSIRVCLVFFVAFGWRKNLTILFVLSNLFHVGTSGISFENFNEFKRWHSWYGTTQESKLEDLFIFSIHAVISVSFSDFEPSAPGKTM